MWPASVRSALAGRVRVRHRRLIESLISDWEHGIDSVLEREWTRLQRLHGLPAGDVQVRDTIDGRTAVRDVVHEDHGLVIELDGFAWHGSVRAHDRDAHRDLAAATVGLHTIRLTYGLVFGDGCATARRIGAVLRAAGWSGCFRPCPECL